MTRREMERTIRANHYSHSIPSGKSWYFEFDSAIVVFSIPANRNIAKFLFAQDAVVLELSRLWAPDGHRPNLLTWAIAKAVRALRQQYPSVQAIISYADPNVGHKGGIYRAASWTFLGQSTEGRYYRDINGQVVARRKFHSGKRSLTKSEILARGYTQLRLPGKLRFVKIIDRKLKLRVSHT